MWLDCISPSCNYFQRCYKLDPERRSNWHEAGGSMPHNNSVYEAQASTKDSAPKSTLPMQTTQSMPMAVPMQCPKPIRKRAQQNGAWQYQNPNAITTPQFVATPWDPCGESLSYQKPEASYTTRCNVVQYHTRHDKIKRQDTASEDTARHGMAWQG